MSADDAADLRKKLDDVRQATAADDLAAVDEIQKRTKELQEASWKVTQQAYQQGGAASSADGENEKNTEEKEKSRFRDGRALCCWKGRDRVESEHVLSCFCGHLFCLVRGRSSLRGHDPSFNRK